MTITRRNPFSGRIVSKDLPVTGWEIARWESGELIQNVWPHLSADEREFIKTGIDDWSDAIPEDELKTAPENPEDKISGNLDGVLVEEPRIWTPASTKIYSSENFRAHKLISLRPILPYLNYKIILAGGSLRNLLNCGREKVCDFDLFFTDISEAFNLKTRLETEGWESIFSCPENKLFTFKRRQNKVQLICENSYASVEQLLNGFDLTPAVAALHCGRFYFSREFVRSVFNKKARIQNVTFPVATIKRIVKYSNKGYSIAKASEDFCRICQEKKFENEEFRHYID